MMMRRLSYLFLVILIFGCSHNEKDIEKFSDGENKENVESEKPVTEADPIIVLPGFKVELLYEVPRSSQGTWVRLALADDGRLVASDQYDQGMYWIEIHDDEAGNAEVHVEKMILPATGAQGLAWMNGSLYANVNGNGLFRMSGTAGKARLDEMKFLGGPESSSEHGNHALIPVRGREELYVMNGNHTPLPSKYTSKVLNWAEDILLTRQWDAQGHAVGIMAPGGYVARINREGENWDILSVGYRNAYDMAIHPNGEMFTFDSDMEWDMGMPWYRPTRILHVVSGSDYGWRSGSGKWKDFYEDSHPSVLDVGPSSPTGVLFGTGARFPEKYQKALYGLDWTYGTIYAFHLKPEGASYTATAEEFLSGHALPVVDAVIAKDGAMYFITGGWSNDTKLYRITYVGDESTEPALYENETDGKKERQLRHRLESFHGRRDARAVAEAWPYLASKDRFIRGAARVAIEFQPVESWIHRYKDEVRPQAVITGTVALARAGDPSYLSDALSSLEKLEFRELEDFEKLGSLRAMSLSFMRLGKPEPAKCIELSDLLRGFLPDNDERVNVELIRLLVFLEDEKMIETALELIRNSPSPEAPDWRELVKRNNSYGSTVEEMLKNPPPVHKLEYLFMLRNLKEGWTIQQREAYFSMINEAADAMGGISYWGFLERMRDEALLTLSDEERVELGDVIAAPIAKSPPFEIKPVEGPGRDWSLNEAEQIVSKNSGKRDFVVGRNAFFATGCASCHRFGGLGGNVGPDLGSVGNRFSTKKILEDIIDPSANISEMYGSSRVTLEGGRTIEGIVVREEAFIKIYRRDPDRAPDIIPSDEVKSIESVSVSQMPPRLINYLNADELKDLIAYLKSGGDPNHSIFN